MPFTKKGKERKGELMGKRWCEEGKCEWLAYSQRIYIYASAFMWPPDWAPWKNICFSPFRWSQCYVSSNRGVKGCVPNKAPWALGTILDSKGVRFKWEEAVSDILSASTQSDPSPTWE
ncbi:hypothetical protein O181_065023 [Austropuccinia psidii MF-1]|uniref:Uncharacterized protein n=1 Tax=Austropuccinia psidii MF-1 TaxID=1389203 RepID=A0A9Q3I267_9BASI|nr:hypothetical protein [Austropuccinia psidii MF-1]